MTFRFHLRMAGRLFRLYRHIHFLQVRPLSKMLCLHSGCPAIEGMDQTVVTRQNSLPLKSVSQFHELLNGQLRLRFALQSLDDSTEFQSDNVSTGIVFGFRQSMQFLSDIRQSGQAHGAPGSFDPVRES